MAVYVWRSKNLTGDLGFSDVQDHRDFDSLNWEFSGELEAADLPEHVRRWAREQVFNGWSKRGHLDRHGSFIA